MTIAGLTEKQTKAKLEADRQARELIRNTYGEEAIYNAHSRLCVSCGFSPECKYLPITTKGEDCPYYKKEVT